MVGGTYHRRFADRNALTVDISLGSASDHPFHSIDETALMVNLAYTIPQGERHSWLFLVNYSNLRPFLNHVPIPGVAFLYNPSEEFRAVLGAPFLSVFWRPGQSWLLYGTGSPFFASAGATYFVWGPLQLFTGFNWINQTYLLANRLDPEVRFFHVYKSLSLGLRSPVSRAASLELSGVYYFDRSYREGTSSTSTTGVRTEVDPGFGLQAQAKLRF
jgi:hypothetical protein